MITKTEDTETMVDEPGYFEKGRWVPENRAGADLKVGVIVYRGDDGKWYPVAGTFSFTKVDLSSAAVRSEGRPGRFVAGAWIPSRNLIEIRALMDHLEAKPEDDWTAAERQAWRETQVQIRGFQKSVAGALDCFILEVQKLRPTLEAVVKSIQVVGQALGKQCGEIVATLSPALAQVKWTAPRRLSWAERQAARGYT
jgi:hypothetical protein